MAATQTELFGDGVLSVGEVNALARETIEQRFDRVRVMGEISNFNRHRSGHLYFTLKDADAQLRVVCFRGSARTLRFSPEDGLRVVASGRLTIYEPWGQFQLVAESIEPAGEGELEAAFRRLLEKLRAEGLFDEARKRPLPPFPMCVGVVTSPTGAAVRDIVSTLRRRWPVADVLLAPARVQGDGAAEEIRAALERLARVRGVDVIIVGRGGGSREDLWAFNDEALARAIAACPVPVVSAVGHETDFTVADFAADVRAPTPTGAAEIVAPRRDDVRAGVDEAIERAYRVTTTRIELARRRLAEWLRSHALGRVRSRVDAWMQRLDHRLDAAERATTDAIRKRRSRLDALVARLEALDPRSILARGYAMCSDPETGAPIARRSAALAAGRLRVRFVDGAVRADSLEECP